MGTTRRGFTDILRKFIAELTRLPEEIPFHANNKSSWAQAHDTIHRACYALFEMINFGDDPIAMDTLGLLLAAHVTPANEQERAQVKELAEAVQEVTQQSVEVAFVDQGYTGDDLKNNAKDAGIELTALTVVKLPEAKKGFVLLPRRWVVECSFAWTARFRRLARDFERLPETF